VDDEPGGDEAVIGYLIGVIHVYTPDSEAGDDDARTSSRLSSLVAALTSTDSPSEASAAARLASTWSGRGPGQLMSPHTTMLSAHSVVSSAMTSVSSSMNSTMKDMHCSR